MSEIYDMDEWYRDNRHDPGTCGLIFEKGECPNKYCENHKCVEVEDEKDIVYWDEDWEDPIDRANREMREYKPKKREKFKAIWVTVSPPENVDSMQFFNKMQKKIKNSDFINSAFWAYEWRHNGTENEGIHFHCWVRKSSAWSRARQTLRRCKSDWGWYTKLIDESTGLKDPKYKDFGPDWENDKLKYITGRTWDEDKDNKKLLDVKMREKLKIERIYTKNYDIPVVVTF